MIPNAEDILQKAFEKDWGGSNIVDYRKVAMTEYARQVLDHAAEVAQIRLIGSGFLQKYEVDKESILEIKNEL